MKKILFFILGFTLIFSDSYKVIKVSDGDTITVMSLQQYNKFKVRLYGIDAPESDQSFGTQSKQFLSDQILNREIELEIKDTDRYKREVAIIFLNNVNINGLMVKEGWAWWYESYAKKDLVYKELQEEAQAKKRGMWSKKGNIPPWEYRKAKKK